jgi:hypothetical protein
MRASRYLYICVSIACVRARVRVFLFRLLLCLLCELSLRRPLVAECAKQKGLPRFVVIEAFAFDSFVQHFRDSSQFVSINPWIIDVAYAPSRLPRSSLWLEIYKHLWTKV